MKDLNRILYTPKFLAQKKFWINQFNESLQTDEKIGAQNTRVEASIEIFDFEITKEISERIVQISKGSDISVFILLLSAYNILEYKYYLKSTVTVQSPVYKPAVTENTFNEHVVISNLINNVQSCKDIVLATRERVLSSYENQDYPIDRIINSLQKLKKNDIYVPRSNIILKQIHDIPLFDSNKFDRRILFDMGSNKIITGKIGYNKHIYSKNDVNNFIHHFKHILKQLVEDINKSVSEVSLLTDQEAYKIYNEFNLKTNNDFPKESLYRLLHNKAVKTPDKIAIIYKNVHITVSELLRRVDLCASYLYSKGIRSGSIVPIYASRKIETIITILSINKLGGIYAPIDVNYPIERIKYILSDIGCDFLLTDQETSHFVHKQIETITIQKCFEISDHGEINEVCDAEEVYIIYTSGTTGKPKGTIIKKDSVNNYLSYVNKRFDFSNQDIFLLKSSLAFDVSIFEMFSWIVGESSLVILPSKFENIPEKIAGVILNSGVTIATFVPSMLTPFMEYVNDHCFNFNLRYIFVGGEVIKQKQVKDFFQCFENTKLINAYGPTEATVDVCFYECNADNIPSNIPIGKPVNNSFVYIKDDFDQIRPLNFEGELCIKGIGLAKGYLNNPDLTFEKFYFAGEKEYDSWIYRTGDIAKWNNDGNISFLGRKDNQYQIRGNRVELEDIENTIANIENVKDTAVIINEENENKLIVSFVVPHNNFIDLEDERIFYYTVAQQNKVKGDIEKLYAKQTPAFFGLNEMQYSYWDKLYDLYSDIQIAFFENNKVIAAINAVLVFWEDTTDFELNNWEECLRYSIDNLDENGTFNTLCVQITIKEEFRKHHELYSELIKLSNQIAQYKNIQILVIPYRPVEKEKYTGITLEEFLNSHAFSMPYHKNLQSSNGKILKINDKASVIKSSIDSWKKLSNKKINQNNRELQIDGILAPLHIDELNHTAIYHDPLIWLKYEVPIAEKSKILLSADKLREELSNLLPEYMIPGRFIFLNQIEVLPNGKKNIVKLLKLINKSNGYVAPNSEKEKMLAQIWGDVFGKEKISINDDFFSLGGDSIKSIQIAAKLNKFGHKVDIQDLFEYTTIRQLSTVIEKNNSSCDNTIAYGQYPLTPIQCSFFEFYGKEASFFNHATSLSMQERADIDQVKDVFEYLINYHDILKSSFRFGPEKVSGYIPENGINIEINEFDLRGKPDEASEIKSILLNIQQGIDLQSSILINPVLFHLNDADRIIIIVHHLIIDAISWHVLLQDLQQLFLQLKSNEPFSLSQKPVSYKYWAEKLYDYATSNSLLDELEYWLKVEQIEMKPLPCDFLVQSNKQKDVKTKSICLGKDNTQELLQNVNGTYSTTTNDILITALGMTLCGSILDDHLLLALEGHGREPIIKGIDVSTTVGWFTSLFPVVLNFQKRDNIAKQIIEVKDYLHKIPNKGIGYGILRYLTPKQLIDNVIFKQQPQISFNYLGELNNGTSNEFSIASDDFGILQSVDYEREFTLDLICFVHNAELHVTMHYNSKQFKDITIQSLLDNYKNNLNSLIAHCTSQSERVLTSSDFTYNDLSSEELDSLFN